MRRKRLRGTRYEGIQVCRCDLVPGGRAAGAPHLLVDRGDEVLAFASRTGLLDGVQSRTDASRSSHPQPLERIAAMEDPPRPSSSAGDSSSESTNSSDTIAGPSTQLPITPSHGGVLAEPETATHDELATTPTPQTVQLARTPPSSTSAPSYAAIAAKSPHPPAHAQTPPPRPRTHSNTTAASSSFSSPARRDLSASDAIVHEEDPSMYGTAGEEVHDDEEDRFFTPMQGGVRRPSASVTGARTRPPSGAVPSSSVGARRSISINTSVSTASSVPAHAPPPRQALHHPQSSARLSVVPSVPSSASHSRSRQPASGPANPRRSVSRTGQHSAASSSRGGSSGSEADSDDGERRRRTRRGVQSAAGSDDDEVVTRDRGEELVRKRMKERKVRANTTAAHLAH